MNLYSDIYDSMHFPTIDHLIARMVQDDRGQDLAEYALLMTFIAMVCLIGLQNLGTAVNNTFSAVSTSIVSGS